MKKQILIGILTIFFLIPSQAQVLKNLKKKAEIQLEQTETYKIANKAAMAVSLADQSQIPETYEFEWRYVMEMKNKDGEMQLEYFLKKDAPYFGLKLPNQEGMFMVMDGSRNLMVMYMNTKGAKMVTASKIPNTALKDTENENNSDEFDFKEIGNKTILGYDCNGFQAENKDGIYTFYITSEPDISFTDIFKSDQINLPANFDPKWIEDGKGLMMQMILEDKKILKTIQL